MYKQRVDLDQEITQTAGRMGIKMEETRAEQNQKEHDLAVALAHSHSATVISSVSCSYILFCDVNNT